MNKYQKYVVCCYGHKMVCVDDNLVDHLSLA